MEENNVKPWRIADPYLSSLLILDRDDETKADQFHGAFIPAVPRSFFLRLTAPGSWTWDPFAGSGTTQRAATGLDQRHVFMTDLHPTASDIYKADARQARVTTGHAGCPCLLAPGEDDVDLFQFDMVLLHPPYANIIKFSDDASDLSGFTTPGGFLVAFGCVVKNVVDHLKPGGFLGVVMGDIWRTGFSEWVPLAFRCVETALDACPDLSLRAVQIKDIKGNRQDHKRNLRRARCFNAGTVEFTHEYMLTFKKVRR